MFDYQQIERQFSRQGYVIIPKLFEPERIVRLKIICDGVLHQWAKQSLNYKLKPNKKSLGGLTDFHRHGEHIDRLEYLLDTISDPKILFILRCVCKIQLIFNGTVYFFNPTESSWQGDWHRDGQINAPDDDVERHRIFNSAFIRVHIALLSDCFLEIVPGSHARWDSPKELEIRKGANKLADLAEMPSARICLNPGDAVFFDGYSIHRGNYLADKPRRTLALLYGSPVDWFTPLPTCFAESRILDRLHLKNKVFFRRFVDVNQNQWSME